MYLKNEVVFLQPPLLRGLQVIIYSSILLYFGRDVFIPVSFALLVSFVLYPVCVWLEQKGVGRLTAIILALSILVVLGVLLVTVLINQFLSFLDEWPSLQVKINNSLNELSQSLINAFGLSKEQQTNIIHKMSDQSGSSLLMFLRSTISASAFSAVVLFLIPVYAVLILYYRQYWMKVLIRLFPSEKKESLREIISLTIATYYNFIKGMAIVYLIVGLLNSLGLLLLGIPHPFLFGFIASILTFVPYVGIIAGSLLPITMAWITYDSIWYPVGIVAIFAFIQYLEANVIFPLAVSKRLNVNALVMLLAILIGGVLWGMPGMILFVPFVGIAKLIADHNPEWKTLSMILGMEKG